MTPQLFVYDFGRGETLRPEIQPVRNDSKALRKPRGGLWTSTYDPDYGSGWVRWCMAYRYTDLFELTWIVLSVAESARIARIESESDLMALIDAYSRMLRGRRGLDFERLAKDYDGLHLTHTGYLRTRSRRSRLSLMDWDCESTLWFRWAFKEWREVEPHFKDSDRYNELWLELSGWTAEDYTCRLMPAEKASKRVYDTMLYETVAKP